MKIIKGKITMFVFVGLFLSMFVLSSCSTGAMKTEKRATERLEAYAEAIDFQYETPEKIYPYLSESFRNSMTEEEFASAFNKERSYPYLTPLYIYDPVVQLSDDGLSGTATYTQAARLEGMTYTVNLVYENGDYYINDWNDFLDGSYLDKFEDTPYSLDWYYDVDALKEWKSSIKEGE